MSVRLAWPTVTCRSPRVFFRGQYACRTLGGVMAVISGLVPSAFAAAAAVYISKISDDRLSFVVGGIFALCALVFGVAGLWALWGLVRNRRYVVEINENGILYGNRFWPWERIRSFAGTRYDNGVCLEFTPRRRPVWSSGMLHTTPLLTDVQYIELAGALGAYVSIRFPHVVVATVPENATPEP